MFGNPRLLVAYTFGAALVVGAIIALGTGSWWVLAAAVLLHFAASAYFLWFTAKRIAQEDKPDPVTEARLEAEGKQDDRPDPLTESGRAGDREVFH